MTLLKFCGLRSASEVDLAVRLGADFVGFVVLAPKSARDVPTRVARSLAQHVTAPTRTVLVTPSENETAVLGAVAELAPDVVQLTGNVRPRLSAECAKRHGALVWRAVAPGADEARDLVRARSLAQEGDAVVLDAATGYGGTGHAVDWDRAGRLVAAMAPKRVVLAGGLTPENVADAIARAHPWCVDVSSGIETEGTKDAHKMRAFAGAVREVKT